MRRVVVTGMGCVSPIGIGVSSFDNSLMESRSGIFAIPDEERVGLSFSQVARIPSFVPQLRQEQILLAERSAQFAIVSAREALQQSGIINSISPDRIAIIFGCSAGGRNAEEPELAKLYAGKGRVHPLTIARVMASSGASLVSMEHGIMGPTYTVFTACASGAHAIGQAFHMVRVGMVDAAVTGGHEAPLTHGFLHAWESMRVVSRSRCRPFAADRDGLTLGEGAAILVLEEMEAATRRGAAVLGEIVGFGMSSDAQHMTHPNPAGPAMAMRAALRDCGSFTAPICYINAHGTGTVINDAVEASAIRDVFQEKTLSIPVSSTKAMHGHAMGASGAMEALATILALQNKIAPSVGHLEAIDPTLGLDVITGTPRKINHGIALSNSFAFGGLNAALAFRSI